jgi:Domain of unknown function (DUF222)
MFEDSGTVGDLVARLAAVVDELLGVELSACSREELLLLTVGVERQRRRLSAADHRLVGQLDSRGVAKELCVSSTAALLSQLLRVGRREAAARVAAAAELGPRHAVTGERLAPVRSRVAAAQADGEISEQHARVIREAITVLPARVQGEQGEAVEQALVEHAAALDPDQLARVARRLGDVLDPDGALTEDADRDRRREVTLTLHRDGSGRLRGCLTPACTAVWQPLLDCLSQPVPAGADGIPDGRSGGQRRHDALLDAGRRLLHSGDLPDAGGTPVTVAVTIDLTQLESRTGLVSTGHGGAISVAQALRLACEAEVVPVVLGDGGGVLSYGRTRRIGSRAQRRALAARDGGCTVPGCDRPPERCDVHHVISWLCGGHTDLNNLCLVCGFHHRAFERGGWRCQMINGIPHWIPPAWLDPDQTPRRNTVHRPEQLLLT